MTRQPRVRVQREIPHDTGERLAAQRDDSGEFGKQAQQRVQRRLCLIETFSRERGSRRGPGDDVPLQSR